MTSALQKSFDERDEKRKNWKPSGKSTSVPTQKETVYDETFVRFINFKPNDTQKGMFDEWVSAADIWGLLDRIGDDGYKLTVKFDETSKAYNALLMDRRKKSPVCGCILSVRASTMAMAIARLVFVHTALAGINWENLSVPVETDW